MTLREYWHACRVHDWLWPFAGHTRYRRGSAEATRLATYCELSPAYRAIHDGWRAHHTNGTPWGTTKPPAPPMPAPDPAPARAAQLPGQLSLYDILPTP
jgi:hypothetical protein